MFKAIQLRLARIALNRATSARIAYDRQAAGKGWNVLVSVALRSREDKAAQRLARLINPAQTFILGF